MMLCVILLSSLATVIVSTNEIRNNQYEVLDIGASKGGSATAIAQIFEIDKKDKVLGINLDPIKVKLCKSKNLTCILQNILNWSFSLRVKGVTSFHVI